jgi:hypothetical protein
MKAISVVNKAAFYFKMNYSSKSIPVGDTT